MASAQYNVAELIRFIKNRFYPGQTCTCISDPCDRLWILNRFTVNDQDKRIMEKPDELSPMWDITAVVAWF